MKVNKNRKVTSNVLVVTNSLSEFFKDYTVFIKPYLVNFGVPYEEMDIGKNPVPEIDFYCYSLIISGHKSIFTGFFQHKLLNEMEAAVSNGVGLLNFDWEFFDLNRTLFGSIPLSNEVFSNEDKFVLTCNNHYITSGHEKNEDIQLYKKIKLKNCTMLTDSEALIFSGGCKLLETGRCGTGRIVNWTDYSWISHEVKGPISGMDDLIWRGMVWAARKPFVMQGMPPFITMRVDDVWGSERNNNISDPLYWVGVCIKYGFKPWLGIFINNITPLSLSSLKKYFESGSITVFPHAFSGNKNKIGNTTLNEEWIYFDHWNKKDYSDSNIENNMQIVRDWHQRNNIPVSKVAIGHCYEIGKNALTCLLDLGCEFTAAAVEPGNPSSNLANGGYWIKGGPYREYELVKRTEAKPAYYAHYIHLEDCPELDGKFYNCFVEIRDDRGYEWAPDDNVESTVEHGFKQLKRSLDSMVLATLFTHESDYVQYILPENWEIIIKGVTEKILIYNPIFVTLDYACSYIRAKNNLYIKQVTSDNNKIFIELEGNTDMPTFCYLFTEDSGGDIKFELLDIPEVTGTATIRKEYN